MKRIEALVPSDKVREVREAIQNAGAGGLLVTNARGQGSGERPEVTGARGTGRHTAEYNTIESIMTVVDDSKTDTIVAAILNAASTGNKGDGKVFVTPVEAAFDIGSKQSGSTVI